MCFSPRIREIHGYILGIKREIPGSFCVDPGIFYFRAMHGIISIWRPMMYQQQPPSHSQKSDIVHPGVAGSRAPLVIGRSLNVLNPLFQKTLEERDEALLMDLAGCQIAGGAGGLAINPGPAKELNQHLDWVLEILIRNFDVPLFVPAHSARLTQGSALSSGKCVLNGVATDPEVLRDKMQLALRCNADLVVLLFRSGSRSTLNDKLALAVEVLELAAEIGFDHERLYLDPVITSAPDPLFYKLRRGRPALEPLVEAIRLLDLLTGEQIKIIMDIGNINGAENHDQNDSFFKSVPELLFEAGLDGLIMDCGLPEPLIH